MDRQSSRRSLLAALPTALVARRALAEVAPPPIQVKRLTHLTLDISDVGRSVDFNQGLFGRPLQALRIQLQGVRDCGGSGYLGDVCAG